MPLRAPHRTGARAGAAALVAAAVSGGCLPDERPYWVIDHTDALAMQFEVIERGPYGAEPPPGQGPVAEAMPGDRVRATPFVAGVDGPVDVASLRPRWFVCGGNGCTGGQVVDLEAAPRCDPVTLPQAETCALGEGATATFELGPLVDVAGAASLGVMVMMVAGTPEGPSTAECLRRAAELDRTTSSLRECLFFVRTLRVGPLWRTVLVGALTGAASPVAPEALPWALAGVEPDVPPRIERFAAWVPAPGGGEYFVEATPGATLSVGTGEKIALSLIEGAPPQTYYRVAVDQSSGRASVTPVEEVRGAAWFSTADAAFTPTGDPGFEAVWQAPEEPGTYHVYVVLADERSATGGWLRVEVERR